MRSRNRRWQWVGVATALVFVAMGSAQAGLVDTFDPPNPAVTATQAFQPPPVAVTAGGPTGDFLRLINDGVNNQRNHYSYDRTDAGAYSTIVANFDFAGFSADQPADGMAVLWVPTSIYGTSGPGPDSYQDPNFAGTFGLGFHTYPGGTNSVSAHWDGTTLGTGNVATGSASFRNGEFNRAHVEIQQIGNGSSVKVDLIGDVHNMSGGGPRPVVTAIDQFVPGLLPYESRMQFTGRSGGANMTVDLDNVDVQYSNPYVPIPTVSPTGRQIIQDWDSAGASPYTLQQSGTAPGPVPQAGGPTGAFLRLINDGVNSQNNIVAFDRITEAGTFGSITADFDFRGISAAAPADGFSFILAPTAQAGTSGPGIGVSPAAEEPNAPNTFAIGFDVHPGENEVSLHWNNRPTREFDLNTGDIDLDSGVFNRAHVEITPAPGGSNVLLELTPDVHGTPGPTVTAFDQFVQNLYPYESRAQFNARSGGLNMTVDLDNVAVEYANPMAVPSVSPTTLYQDFDSAGGTDYTLTQAGSSPGPIPVAGGPAGNFLRLINDNVNSQNNRVTFDRAPDGGVSNTVSATFDFSGYDAPGGNTAADGFSIVLLPTATHGRSGAGPGVQAEEPNLAGALGVGFDLWQNINEVSVHYNGAVIAANNIPTGQIDLDAGVFHRAEIIARHAPGGSNVTVTLTPDIHGTPGAPVTVFNDLFVAGMVPYDYRAMFTGRTGGANMGVDLDNIISGSAPYAQVGTSTVQDFEGGGGTEYKGHWFRDGSPPALLSEPGNTFLRLTHNQGSTENAVAFEKTFDGSAAAIDAQFSLRIGGSQAADGGSFVLLNTAAYGDSGEIPNASISQPGYWEEPNLTGTFGIGFDIHPNTSEVSLHWNGVQVANVNTIAAFGADMRGAGWLAADLAIDYDAAGAYVTLTETNYGIPIYNNHFIPGMQPYESRVVLGARTGGAVSTIDVDDVNVQYTAGGDFIWKDPVIGDYTDGARWDAGTSPSGADNAFIHHGQAMSTNLSLSGTGSLTIDGTGALNEGADLNVGRVGGGPYVVNLGDNGQLTVGGSLWVGREAGASGAIVQTGGNATVNGWILALGDNATATGSYELSGGTLTCNTDYFAVGRQGVGHFVQSGTSVVNANLAQRLLIGDNPGADGSSYTMTGGTLNVNNGRELGVGKGSSGAFYQSGGVVNASGRLALATGGGAQPGRYELSGDAILNVGGDYVLVGQGGQGTFIQSGTSTVNANLGTQFIVGDWGGAVGHYEMSGGTLNVNNGRTLYVGKNGTGTFVQTGGTVNATGDLFLADGNAAVGTYNISGNAQLNIGGLHTVIGRQGLGHFTQSDNAVVNAQRIFLAEFNGSAGSTYTMNGGTLNAATGATGAFTLEVARGYDATFTLNDGILNVTNTGNEESMLVGRNATGIFNQNGGVVNVNRRLHIGQDAPGHGIYNLAGGDLNVGVHLVVGAAGTGVINQTGGTVTQTGGGTYIADGGSATGTYNLSGGTLNANYLRVGEWGGAQGTVNVSGTGVLNSAGDALIGARGIGALNIDGGTTTIGGAMWVAPWDASVGHVTQTGGAVTVNGWILALADSAASTATYDISGGSLDVNGSYLIVGRQGVGHMIIDGASTQVNAATNLFVGDMNHGADGSTLTIHDGTLTVGSMLMVGLGGNGSALQTGGVVNAPVRLHVAGSAGGTGEYRLEGGEVNVGQILAVGDRGQGTFIQTGGTVNLPGTAGWHGVVIGDQDNSDGTYEISGGTMAVNSIWRGGHVGNKSTLRVITGAPVINANWYRLNNNDCTLAMAVANDGVATVNLTDFGDIGGTLEMSIHNNIALTAGDSFLLMNAGNSINGDFASKVESVFTANKVGGNQYIATYDPAQGQGTVEAAVGTGWEIVFPKANQGWVQIDNADSWPTLELLLDIDFNGALPGNDLDALIDYIDEAGFAIEKPEGTHYDLKLLIAPHTDDPTSFFAWDLSGFDENVGLIGIGANIPEPATLSLLALGALGLLRRRRRNRS